MQSADQILPFLSVTLGTVLDYSTWKLSEPVIKLMMRPGRFGRGHTSIEELKALKLELNNYLERTKN